MTNNEKRPHATSGKTEESRKRQLANLRPDARVKHRGFSKNDWFTEEEKALYDEMFDAYREAYEIEDPANLDILSNAVKSFIKSQKQDEHEFKTGEAISHHAKNFAREFADHMKLLGLDRRFQLSTNNTTNANNYDLALLNMIGSEFGPKDEDEQAELEED